MNEDRTLWWWAIGAVVVVAGIAGGWYWWRQTQEAPPPLPPPVALPTPEPAKDEGKIEHPIEQAQVEQPPAPPPLPELADSDAALVDALVAVVGQKSVTELLALPNLIRRIVATVDNLPREKMSTKVLPLKPVAGRFIVNEGTQGTYIGADNAGRYALHVRLAEAVDAKKLVALYVRFYPLFQQAYQELGYPKGYFNDRLVVAIDDLLAAPEPPGPVKLLQPKVLYEYESPDLESRSAGQKIMIRMGAQNAAKVKNKLREIRKLVVREVTKS
jgi:hypothetical protein